jgi:protein TonB
MYYNYYIPSNDSTLSEEEKKSLPYMIKTKSSFKVWSKAEYWGKNTTVFIVDHTTSDFESGDITSKVGKEPYVIKSNDYLKNKDNWILPEEPILTFVEKEANFIGGYTKFNKYIETNMKYPSTAEDMGIKGRVIVKFIVEKDGSITNVEVENGIEECPECNQEAIRLLKNSPKWNPAMNDGKAVRTVVRVPIKFDK